MVSSYSTMNGYNRLRKTRVHQMISDPGLPAKYSISHPLPITAEMALRGINVIEMAGLAPAPFCGLMLSDFGARVIRVDRPNAPDLDKLGRGKESISINLKKPEGVNVVKHLCQKADVLIEPFRPGVMEKLGLGPETLTQANPGLIYARLTGYGQTGMMSQAAGHDINYIALSGQLSKLGRKHEKPYPPINYLADFAGGGMICAYGILLALYERTISGNGQVIDANMLEGSAYLGSWIDASKELLFNQPRGENMLDGAAAFYNTYETKDGKFVAVGAIEPKFYQELLKGLGLADSNVSQTDDQDEQQGKFAQIFRTKTRDEWTEVFKNLDACVTPILSVEEAAEFPHNKGKGTFQKESHGCLQAAPAPRFSRIKAVRDIRPLPQIGQHTVSVLSDFKFEKDEIMSLMKRGVLFGDSNSKL